MHNIAQLEKVNTDMVKFAWNQKVNIIHVL